MGKVAALGSTCKKCSGADLSAYVDGMLDGETMRKIAAHLDSCADCRRVYEGLSQTKALLYSLSAPSRPPQADFWAETYRRARLEARGSRPARALPLWNWPALKYRWSIAAATAGVAIVTIGIALSPFIAPSTTPVRSAMPSGPTLDVSQLVGAHAQYAAEQPLADDHRLSIVLSDAAQSDPLTSADADDPAGSQAGDASANPVDFSGSKAVQNAAGQAD